MTYLEKLQDPRWQQKRLLIFQRDGFLCQKCRVPGLTLHVHHIKYFGEPWEAEDSKLITLCKKCHDDEESTKKSLQISLTSVSERTGVLITDLTELIIQVFEWSDRDHSVSFRTKFEQAIELIKQQDRGKEIH